VLLENEQGKSNWDFSPGEKPEQTSGEAAALGPPTIAQLALENIDLSLHLGTNSRHFVFKTLSVNNVNIGKKSSFSSSLVLDGLPLSLKGGFSSIAEFLIKISVLFFEPR